MEDAGKAMVLLYDLCRLCLDEPGVINIFKPVDWSQDILTYTGLQLTTSEKFPQTICSSCRDIITCAKVLKDVATANDKRLHLIGESNEQSDDNIISVRKDLFDTSDSSAVVTSTKSKESPPSSSRTAEDLDITDRTSANDGEGRLSLPTPEPSGTSSNQATPATREDNQLRRSKKRGKRAGKLVASRLTASLSHQKITQPEDSSNKKRSYTAAFKANELCVAVTTDPFHYLTAKQANGIKITLEKKLIADLLNPSTAGHMANVAYRGKAHFSDGVLKLWCEDNVALQWLRLAVEDIASPIPGSKLVVRPQSEIQRRILCGLLVPDLRTEINTMRQILVANNNSVNIRSWTLVKAEKQTKAETPGVYLLLRIPESDVEKLKKQERRLNWMFGNIYVRILEEASGTCTRGTTTDPAQPKPPSKIKEGISANPPERQAEMDVNIPPSLK